MRIRAHAAATHAGRKRRRNEDAYVERPPLFAVADGMGGAQAGEVASRLAAAALEDEAGGATGTEQRVVALIEEANRRVFQRATEDEAASGMGTTMTVALVDDDRVTIGHVGDSRAYRFRDGEIEQLTDDHSLVAELVRSGRLTPEEADTHPQRSVITRAVGTDPDIDVDRFTVEAAPGDVYLICSDGLSDMLDKQQIRDVFAEHPNDLEAAAKALVRAANRVGGDDNITVVCFQIGEEPSGEQTQAMDLPTKENALSDEEDTLSGLDGPTAIHVPAGDDDPSEPAETPDSRRFAIALLLVAVVVLAPLVWLIVR
jgi:PPM family protein phosphatase